MVSGGADGVITLWEDVTLEVESAKAAEAEELVLKCVDLSCFDGHLEACRTETKTMKIFF